MSPVTVSVIIPAYNEEKRIGRTLASIRDFFRTHSLSHEVIVVDDGSTDNTAEVAQRFANQIENLRVIRFPKNKGKGAAVKEGMLAAVGNNRLFMDADSSTNIAEYKKLAPYLSEGCDVVVGSRHVRGAHIHTRQGQGREILGHIFRTMVRLLLPTGVRDTQAGFKLFSAKAAMDIFSKTRVAGWMFDVEILSLARQHNYRIQEVPIDWNNDAESRMRMRHMVTMVRDIIRLIHVRNRSRNR